jgi:hypothetical protein
MEDKRCPDCKERIYLDVECNKYRCIYCGFKSEAVDQFKENDLLLDSFVDLIFDCIQHPENYNEPRWEVKNSLLRLLNSL